MKNITLLFGLFVCTTGLFSQATDPSKYGALITGEALKADLTILASDEMQGRETGTEGQRKAAVFIESRFKSIGLSMPENLKSYQQLYPLFRDSLISSTLVLNNKTLLYGKDYVPATRYNITASIAAKKLVFAGYGIDDSTYTDYNNLDVKDKVVLFFMGEPMINGKYLNGSERRGDWAYGDGTTKKLQLAMQKGAVAAVVINLQMDTITRNNISASQQTQFYMAGGDTTASLNYAIIAHAVAKNIIGKQFDSLLAKVKTNRPITKTITLKKKTIAFGYEEKKVAIDASNVIGVIEGTDKKDEYVFLTAHYDHLGMRDGKIYYGADDDGSGTCSVIQMAAAFAKAKADGNGPRRTLVFMTVSGEEKGLWGSEYYSDHPVFPLDKTSVDLNTDMVGRVDTERQSADTLNYLYVVGHDKISSDLPVINEAVNDQHTKLTLDYKFDDPNDKQRIYYRSDHYNFARKGVPVLFFYDGMLKADYHRPTDTVDKINWALYEKRTRLIFYTAWEMANRENFLKRDKPLPTGRR